MGQDAETPIYQGKTLEQWTALLDSEDPVERRDAVQAIKALGRNPDSSVPLLVRALDDPDEYIRCVAAQALATFGPKSAPAIPHLGKLLRDKDSSLQWAATETLKEIGPEAIPTLVVGLATEDPSDRIEKALVRFGPEAVPALAEAIHGISPRICRRSIKVLGEIGPAGGDAALAALRGALQDVAMDVRLLAAEALLAFGDEKQAAIPVVEELLEDPSSQIRCQAAVTLWKLTKAPRSLSLLTQEALADNHRDPVGADRAVLAFGQIGAEATANLIEVLRHGRRDVRLKAVETLGDIGKAGIEGLGIALEDPSSSVRAKAAETLGRIGRGNETVVELLLKTLEDEDSKVRVQGAVALWDIAQHRKSLRVFAEALTETNFSAQHAAADKLHEIGPRAAEIVPVLIEIMKNGDSDVFTSVVDILAEIGPGAKAAVPLLVENLTSDGSDLRSRIVCALGRIHSDAALAVPALTKALGDEDELVRAKAADSLACFGPEAKPAAAALIQAARNDDAWVRARCLEALYFIGLEPCIAVPLLVEALRDSDDSVRKAAAYALGDYGPAAAEAIGPLIKIFAEEKSERQLEIVETLGRIGVKAVPQLAAILRSEEPELRRAAARAIEEIGPEAADAVPALIGLLGDEDEQACSSASRALGLIGSPAIPALTEALRDPNPAIRGGAAGVFGWRDWIDDKAKLPVPTLLEAMQDEDAQVRVQIAYSLAGCVQADGDQVLVALIDALDDLNTEVRRAAVVSLGQLGERAAPAVPKLRRLLDDSSPDDWWDLLPIIAEIGPGAADLVPDLVGLLDETHFRRYSAARALGEIGPAAEEAVPALVAYLEDRDMTFRAEVAKTLWQINRHPRAIPTLIDVLQHDESPDYVAEFLGRIGPQAAAAVPTLVERLEDERGINTAVAEALWKIAKHPAVIPALTRHLEADWNGIEAARALWEINKSPKAIAALAEATREGVRLDEFQQAVFAMAFLRDIGPEAKAAAPALEELLRCSDRMYEEAIVEALEKIDPQGRK